MKSPSGVARPHRASVRRPSSIVGTSSLGAMTPFGEDNVDDENTHIENTALVDNLKKSLRAAEAMCEDQRAQAAALQETMDNMLRDHATLEERLHEAGLRNEQLEQRTREDSKQVREMASLFEGERAAMLRDREEAAQREKELQAAVKRLKETMAGREMRFNIAAHPERRMSRTGTSVP